MSNEAARSAVELAASVVRGAARRLADLSHNGADLDSHQVLAYDLAHATAAVEIASSLLSEVGMTAEVRAETGMTAEGVGAEGEGAEGEGAEGEGAEASAGSPPDSAESLLARAFAAEALTDLLGRTLGREQAWGVEPGWHGPAAAFLAEHRDPVFLAGLAELDPPQRLDGDFVLVQETFRRFGEDQVRPHAEHIHRENDDIPESIVSGLSELGGFGLSVPEEYGGFATGGEHDYLGMVIATEELSRASLGAGGSLITRPEILTRAIVNGGTDEQKQSLLPRIATAELMVAVAVTEPDFGSDVANLTVAAARSDGGGWLINGVKTWCTFAARADILMLLARTDPDRSRGHRGLSLFVVHKERGDGHGFALAQDDSSPDRPAGLPAGKLEGRPIDTIGYRGMHSYELAFENWWVPESALIGGESGEGRGFYLQMAGFENGRLQTAARALGVMQAAYEAALDYARARRVFGAPIIDYQLTRAKLGRMATVLHACRSYAYEVAALMAKGEGSMEASMVKAYACRLAEWVTREAMQIHGGMGYAEEFPVSRYFLDARVLSIFEGADETLCLKVIARKLIERAAASASA